MLMKVKGYPALIRQLLFLPQWTRLRIPITNPVTSVFELERSLSQPLFPRVLTDASLTSATISSTPTFDSQPDFSRDGLLYPSLSTASFASVHST